MAHKPPSRNGASSKAHSILEFASHLTKWISTWTQDISQPFPDPDLYFHSLPLQRRDVSPDERIELDQKGVQLWNACCKVNRDEVDEKIRMHLVQARAFAYFMLESASSQKTSAVMRSIRNGCRAVRDCISCDLFKLASEIIMHLAELQRKLDTMPDKDTDATSDLLLLKSDFLLLRIMLSWRQSRLDMADHFFHDLMSGDAVRSADFVSKAVDLCYEIGLDQLQTSQHEMATKWLKRAADFMQADDQDMADAELGDMRLNVLHTLVRALLSSDNPEAGEEASRVLEVLRKEFGHKLAVSFLEIELLSKDPGPNTDAYLSELSRIIRTMHLIEPNHKVVLHHIHRIKDFSISHALRALKIYITQRLASDGNEQRIEEAIVTYVWMATVEKDGQVYMPAEELRLDLDALQVSWEKNLSPEAAHAVLLLLWKQIDHVKQDRGQEYAVSWCNLGLHSLLGQAGDKNVGKIQRKLIAYYMSIPDYRGAKSVMDQMSQNVKQQPLSLYLAYSIGLRCKDDISAERAIHDISKVRGKDNQLLFACVGETMRYGTKRQGAKLLQRVLDKFNYELPEDMDTCVMLRCTAQLIISVLTEERHPDAETLSRLCGIFRAAANYTVKNNVSHSQKALQCSIGDCRWFERNSYNISLENLHDWPLKTIIDLVACSEQIEYPKPQALSTQQVKQEHKVATSYLQCVLYITEARRSDATWTIEEIPRTSYSSRERPEPHEIQLHLYRNAFNQYSKLKQLFEERSNSQTSDAAVLDDARLKVATLLPLAFEALLALSLADASKAAIRFDHIGLATLITTASKLEAGSKTYAFFADMILSAAMTQSPTTANEERLPLHSALTLLQKVIAAIRKQEDYDVAKAARWIRCVVQIVLEYPEGHVGVRDGERGSQGGEQGQLKMVEGVVDEALTLARDASTAAAAAAAAAATGAEEFMSNTAFTTDERRQQTYPSDELEWLSTVLFNLAVDFYVKEDMVSAKLWAEKAVNVADVLANMARGDGGDGGLLRRCLRERCGKMGF